MDISGDLLAPGDWASESWAALDDDAVMNDVDLDEIGHLLDAESNAEPVALPLQLPAGIEERSPYDIYNESVQKHCHEGEQFLRCGDVS